MCDPIKASDGRTYDRWTIIDHNLVKSPYDASITHFGIVFDDIDVRRRLFRKFPEQEQHFRLRRERHRVEAFKHADRGEYADSLVKLNHVLQWNRSDKECARKRDEVQHLLRHTPQSAPSQPQPPRPERNLPSSTNASPEVSPGPRTQRPARPLGEGELIISADGAANWNPQARLHFGEGKLSVKVETRAESTVSPLASQCCPESFKGLPGYYFEVLLKSGGGLSIGFDVLSNKEVVKRWIVGKVKVLDDSVGFISYSSGPQVNVQGRGLAGEVSCCFDLENVEDDRVFGDAPLDTIRCGDTLGAGVNFQRREIFFTKNHQLRWLICNVSLKPGYAWIPSFGVESPGAEILVNFGNFGQRPFLFAYESLFNTGWRKRVNGRRIDMVYYRYDSFKEEREVGRALGTEDWDSTALEESSYKKILVGEIGAVGSEAAQGSLRSTSPYVAPTHLHELYAKARYPKASLTFSADRLGVLVATNEVTTSVDLLANRVCPRIYHNLPGYYFEVLLKAGEEISVGMCMLRNKLCGLVSSATTRMLMDGWKSVPCRAALSTCGGMEWLQVRSGVVCKQKKGRSLGPNQWRRWSVGT